MGRWLAPLLPGPQHWVLHDRDADLLAVASHADDTHPETVALVRALLRPVDDYRAASGRRQAGGGTSETPDVMPGTPTTPVPVVE